MEIFEPKNAIPVKNPSGHIIMDSIVVADTLQCVHCGSHWIPMKGSGRVRGFCTKCNGPVCGIKCAVCIPFEKKLDIAERLPR